MSMLSPISSLPLFESAARRDEDARPSDPSFILAPGTLLERRFADFHRKNSSIYRALEKWALVLLSNGRTRIGIAELVEELRYDSTQKSSGDPFKVNNSFRSYYARLLIYKNLQLDGVIEVRTLQNHKKKEHA